MQGGLPSHGLHLRLCTPLQQVGHNGAVTHEATDVQGRQPRLWWCVGLVSWLSGGLVVIGWWCGDVVW